MQRIINFENVIGEEILQYLPTTPKEQEFQEKYINPDKNYTLESDLHAALADCELQAFYAGYRTAVAVLRGKSK